MLTDIMKTAKEMLNNYIFTQAFLNVSFFQLISVNFRYKNIHKKKNYFYEPFSYKLFSKLDAIE